MKRLLLCLLILISVLSFAWCEEGNFSLAIKNADSVRVKGSFIKLTGNVNLDFTSESGDSYVLTAKQVTLDTDNKTLDASGNVILTQKEENQAFRGELVTLDWEHLDIKVFDGKSVSERTGASDNKVTFYSQGQSISYAGEGNTVLFKDGIVSTKGSNTNWSINAKEIALLDSDLFFRNATLRIGRVPLFWFPVFYYPSSRLGFNPSVGVSDKDEIFINTTTELFGTYSMGSSSGSVQESETDEIAGAVLSLLKEDDDTVLIRDGLLYKKYDEDQKLGKVESWARKTGSYMILTADAYQSKGFSFGYETKQKYKSSKVQITSKAISAIDPGSIYPNFRLGSETDITVRGKHSSFSLSLPYYTDSTVKKQYYNRNKSFSFDSIFGTQQKFPTSYSSAVTGYTWSLSGNYSRTIGNFTFALSSLKSSVTFIQDTEDILVGSKSYTNFNKTKIIPIDEDESYSTYGFKISSITLPALSFSSSGTFIDWTGESSSKTEDRNYNTFISRLLSRKNSKLEKGTESIPEKSIAAPDVSLTKTISKTAPQFRINYNLNYNLDNYYNGTNADKEDASTYFDKRTLSNTLSGTLTTYAKAPGDWLSFTDTLSPSYSYTLSEEENTSESINLTNSLSASMSKLGLSYSLSQKLYSKTKTYTKKTDLTKETPYYGKFDSTSVTSNQLSFRKSIKALSLGLTTVFKPLTESITPNISYSKNGLSISSNFSMRRALDAEKYTKSAATLNLSYSKKFFTGYFNNTYDFTIYNLDEELDWDGYSSNAKASVNFSDLKLSAYGLIYLVDKFEPKSLETGFTFRKSTGTMTFSGKDCDPEKLNFTVKYDLAPHYFWKNRIGLESSMNANLNYNFNNKYATSFTLSFNLGFSISKFLDINLSIVSGNTSFYNYFVDKNGEEVFSIKEMGKDLLKSVDFINGGIYDTNFNLSSISLSIVHYMEDWNLYFEETGKIDTSYGTASFVPEGKVYVKWNVIPEIKAENGFTHYLENGKNKYVWDN